MVFFSLKLPLESFTTNIRDDYEEIHRKSPGLFWDTVRYLNNIFNNPLNFYFIYINILGKHGQL